MILSKPLCLLLILCASIPILSQFTLITNLYNEVIQERIVEYEYCLQRNCAHPLIDRVHINYDTSSDREDTPSQVLAFLERLDTKKLIITKIDKRQTYTDSFSIANALYPNNNIIVANADIFFDSSLKLLSTALLDNAFLCLTRWDITQTGNLKILTDECNKPAVYSQDVWIFKTPIRLPEKIIEMGTLGCDNQIAYEMLKLGYDVYNPCIDIRCCHLHLSAVRHYNLLEQKKINMVYLPWCLSTDIADNSQSRGK